MDDYAKHVGYRDLTLYGLGHCTYHSASFDPTPQPTVCRLQSGLSSTRIDLSKEVAVIGVKCVSDGVLDFSLSSEGGDLRCFQ